MELEEFTPTQLFDSAPAFIAIGTGAEFRFKYVNRAYERLVARSDLIGRTVAEALPEVVPQGFLEMIRDAIESNEPVSGYDVPLRIKPPAHLLTLRRYVDFVFQPLADPSGFVHYVICFGYDVTSKHIAKRRAKLVAAGVQSPHRRQERRIRSAAAGLVNTLSTREREVLEGLIHGKANKAIARELSLSPRTIEMYRGRVYQKLGVESAGAAIRVGLQGGLS